MTGNVGYDSRRMFRHACAFADCAMFCKETPNSIVIRTQWYTVPEIVNLAFASEVFIKSLLIFYGLSLDEIQKNGHGLKELWRRLADTNKSVTDMVGERMKLQLDIDDMLFEEYMKNISNAFKKWRYIYEDHGGKIAIDFLRNFTVELRDACCHVLYKQSWNDYASKPEYSGKQ